MKPSPRNRHLRRERKAARRRHRKQKALEQRALEARRSLEALR